MAEKLIRLHLVSVPCTQAAIDRLQACVDDLGGTIIEEVTTDKADQQKATIIFDENLDN